MRAVICRAWGEVGDLKVENVPAPTPGPGEVLIEVRATAVNYADALHGGRALPDEAAAAVQPGAGDGRRGGRVRRRRDALRAGRPRDGRSCPTAGWPRWRSRPRPRRSPSRPAWASTRRAPSRSPTSRATWRSAGKGGWRPARRCWCWARPAASASTAVEIGKAMGARVIAGASTAEKLAVARERGADDLIDYAAEKLTERVMALTGGKGRRRVLRSGRRRSLRRRAVVARLGRAHPARGVRGRRAADPGQPATGQASRRARIVAPLLPLARARQAAPVGRGADRAGTARASCGRWRHAPAAALAQRVEAIRLLTDRKAHGKVVVVPEG